MKEALIRRTINRASSWFPVVLLSSLAMLTYWLDAQVKNGGRPAPTQKSDPDYFLEDFSATRFGLDGSVVQHLTAKKMIHYPESTPTEIESPDLIDTQPGRPPMRARASAAKVSPDNEHIYLSGNVVAERDSKDNSGKTVLTADTLHVQPKLERADSDGKVTIVDATGRHVGNAFEADNKLHTIKLRNGVVGELPARPVKR